MSNPTFVESPIGLTEEPFPIETGNAPPHPMRKLTSDTFAEITDSHPQFGPSRGGSFDSTGFPDGGGLPPLQGSAYDGNGSGANIMNGAAGFTIDKATIIGGNNVQGQQLPAIFNIFGSAGVEERSRSPGWESYLEAAFKHQTAVMVQKDQELKDREIQLAARELKVQERERVVDEQERTVAQLVQSLKMLEGELQQRRSSEANGDGPHQGKKVRLSGRKYVTPRLRGAFKEYAVGIDDLSHQFDFSTIDLTDRTEAPFFHVPLAPHYGGLDKEQIESFPESLKVAIWSVVNRVDAGRTDKPFTFESIGELLTVNNHLESSGPTQHVKDGPIWLKENLKSTDLSVFNEWFDTLLAERDLHRANQTLAKIKRKGGSQDLPNSAYDTKAFIDVLVLWFPVNVRRSFRISRTTVKLCTTPRQGRFGIGQQKARHFILTEHQTSCVYHPRESFIYQVAKEARDNIVRDVHLLIDD